LIIKQPSAFQSSIITNQLSIGFTLVLSFPRKIMNPAELKAIMKQSLQEAKDLKERILAIMDMELVDGTHLYRLWMEEAACLKQEWLQALDRYSDAVIRLAKQE
jgi:hypothetical protein